MMLTSAYFEHSVRRRRPYLQDQWLQEAWSQAIEKRTQSNGRVSHFLYIAEYDKYLRVVFEGEVVHNAYFDRGYKPRRH